MLEKFRVYELAKELNTTSKRLMEKLAEINVIVKNHMSLLEDHELEALYKHIGIIKHGDGRKPEADDKKAAAAVPPKVEPKKDSAKDTKSTPRIIRTTEIIIDSKNNAGSNVKEPVKAEPQRNDVRGDVRGNARPNPKHDFVRVADANSGLRMGFTRDNRMDFKKDNKAFGKNENKTDVRKENVKEPVRSELRQEPAAEDKSRIKPAANAEMKADVKQEARLDAKPEVREEMKKELKPEIINDLKPAAAETGVQVEKDNAQAGAGQNVKEQAKSPEINSVPAVEADKDKKHSPADENDHGKQLVKALESAKKEHDVNTSANRRPYGDRQQGGYNRPQGDRPYGDRQQGGYNRPQGDRPYGDRQQGGYNRPQGDRPYGDRQQGGYNRPQGDRPYGDRPQGDRPQGDRPYGDRQQGGYNRSQGDRPYGDRQQGGYNRPQGDRPYGDRQQGGYNRPQGDRPYGDRQQGERSQGGYNRPQGDRPYGDRQQGGYNRPQGDRPPRDGFRSGPKSLEIPKPELSEAQKEALNSQKTEARREFQNKDVDKDVKREQKKDVPKGSGADKNKRFKPQRVIMGEKKGVSEVLSEDYILEEFYDNDNVKRTRKTPKPKKDGRNEPGAKHIPHKAVLATITLPESIQVKDLAESLKKTSTEIIKKLMSLGVMATLNHELDFETAAIVAEEFGVKAEKALVVNEEDILFDEADDAEDNLEPRPPVVVVMGHVDHGKTSLLDAVRETNVTESEAGGITQHIGAHMVKINNRNITFLDTPGHEAFTAMRARGAQVTDIAILVVAADDGVMPQTVEAINHAKAANVSIIVAINKIDKPGANPERVKQELTEYGLVAEEWGGETICVPVSAKQRTNIDHLLEMVLLTADILELKANPNRQAKGTVIEAKLDKDRGPIATILVQRGTLNLGDSIVTGTTVGRIRAMTDDKGHKVKKAGPSTPVEILGLPEVPEAGEIFYAITDEKVAKQLAEKRKLKQREQTLKSSAKVSLDDLFNQIKEGKVKDLNIIVKADVQGSVEAVKQSLEKLSNDEVRVNIIHGGVGAVIEADVTLAEVSNAIIIGFNVRPAANVAEAAKNAGVDLRLYRVIYNAIEDIQAAMKGMLEPTFKEVVQGHAEIRQIFKVSGIGTIGGSYVTDGKIIRNSDIRVVRNGIVIHEGKLASLKRFKDDAKEVAQGYECGLSIERFNDIKEGDIVESFVMEEVAR